MQYFRKIVKSAYWVWEQHTEPQQLLRSFPVSSRTDFLWLLGVRDLFCSVLNKMRTLFISDWVGRACTFSTEGCIAVTCHVLWPVWTGDTVSSAQPRTWPERAPERWCGYTGLGCRVCWLASLRVMLASSLGGCFSQGTRWRSCEKW